MVQSHFSIVLVEAILQSFVDPFSGRGMFQWDMDHPFLECVQFSICWTSSFNNLLRLNLCSLILKHPPSPNSNRRGHEGGDARIVETRAFPHPFESICSKSAKTHGKTKKKWQTLWPALGGEVHGVRRFVFLVVSRFWPSSQKCKR